MDQRLVHLSPYFKVVDASYLDLVKYALEGIYINRPLERPPDTPVTYLEPTTRRGSFFSYCSGQIIRAFMLYCPFTMPCGGIVPLPVAAKYLFLVLIG